MRRLLLVVSVISLAVYGCEKERGRIVLLRPPVEWPEVSSVPVEGVADGFVNLASQGTDGVFPSSIAVARVTVGDQADGDQRPLILNMSPANDFLPWNSLFDGLRYVREAFPLHSHDLDGAEPTPARLVGAARRLRAGVCLVYGRGDVTEAESLVRGVLYDTRDGAALAAIEARAWVPAPEEVPHPPEQVDEDMRHCDPQYLADRRFEELVFQCIRELRGQDRPVRPQSEEGWTPEGPLWPRIWPPAANSNQ